MVLALSACCTQESHTQCMPSGQTNHTANPICNLNLRHTQAQARLLYLSDQFIESTSWQLFDWTFCDMPCESGNWRTCSSGCSLKGPALEQLMGCMTVKPIQQHCMRPHSACMVSICLDSQKGQRGLPSRPLQGLGTLKGRAL